MAMPSGFAMHPFFRVAQLFVHCTLLPIPLKNALFSKNIRQNMSLNLWS
jgi:hypothetical protein